MAIEYLTIDIDTFLNNLDKSFPLLLNKQALNVYNEPHRITSDFNIIILYGNVNPVLYKFIYHLFNIAQVREHALEIGDTKIEYKVSDAHIELPLCDDSMLHIKAIVQNKSITNKKFVVVIKNCTSATKQTLLKYKRLVEKSTNAIFVFPIKNLGSIPADIANMGICLNCSFPKQNLIDYFKMKVNLDISDIYDMHYDDLINIILAVKYNITKSQVEIALENFIAKVKKEKTGNAIAILCKELGHKLYHINFPFPLLVKYSMRVFPNKKEMSKLIELAAECDHQSSLSKKKILLYERYIMGFASLL